MQLCSPAPENVFAGHGAHTIDPFTSLKLPAAHSAQASLLVVFLYFPTAHAAHGPSAGPVYPELHKQLEDVVFTVLSAGQHACSELPPTDTEDPIQHVVQLLLPTTFL